MSIDTPSPAKRLLRWLRAGRPDAVAPGDYVAVIAVLNRDLTEAEAEEVATALLDEGAYDDELITFDEINDMIASKIQEQASQEDIEKVSALLLARGINLEPGLPGTDAAPAPEADPDVSTEA